MKVWTEADFDSMSWHDNSVHALHLYHDKDGSGNFSLDIDFIIEWLASFNGNFLFRVIPAVLMFRDVLDLDIDIDYANGSVGTAPFSIDCIRKEIIPRGEMTPDLKWYIDIAWPGGIISFTSPGFVQTQAGAEIITDSVMLTEEERQNAIGRLRRRATFGTIYRD